MNTKEFNEIAAAYAAVYSEAEQLDENRMASRMGKMPSAPAKVGKATHSIKDLTPSKEPSPEEKAKARKALRQEEVDVFDIIIEHLLSEGYANTAESATAILANMSEDWRDSILEAQEARDNPEKYEQGKEKEEHKKYGKVRGESRPMPPRGNKDREAFEKWYATQRG